MPRAARRANAPSAPERETPIAAETEADGRAVGREPSYPVTSVDSALRLLLLFQERRQLRTADAAREVGVARSTAHRLVKMLEFHGFVRQDPATKAYVAGPVLVNIGLQVVRNLDVRTVARPVLESLVERVEETVNLAALQGADVVVLDSIESPRSLRVGSRTGRVMPAYASATGRALLAELSSEQIRGLYPGTRLPRLTERTAGTRRQLERELDATRARGYALQRGEIEPDVAAVAAAVRDPRGEPSFAVTVAVPFFRLTDENTPVIGAAVIESAAELSTALPW